MEAASILDRTRVLKLSNLCDRGRYYPGANCSFEKRLNLVDSRFCLLTDEFETP